MYKLSTQGSSFLTGLAILQASDDIKEINNDLIKETMFYLYKRHPLLQSHIHKTKFLKQIYFSVPDLDTERKTIQDMNFERVRVKSKCELVTVIENFDYKEFNYESKCLMFKLTVFEWNRQNEEVAFAFALTMPHFLSDGINIMTLSIELVNILNSLLQNKQCDEMLKELEVVDLVENLVRESDLITDEMKKNYKSRWKSENISNFKSPQKLANVDADLGAKINLLSFDENSTKKLISYAKLNNIKMNGVFIVAMLNAFKELYKENEIEFPEDLSLIVPISLRHRVKPSVDNSSVRFCILQDFLRICSYGKHESNVEEARYADKLLDADLKEGLIYDSLLNSFSPVIETIVERLSMNILKRLISMIPFNYSLSNIGTYVNDRQKISEGPLKIDEMFFGDMSGGAIYIYSLGLFIQTFNNKLMVLLSTNRRAFDSKHADRFMILFEQQLKSLID